MPQKTKILYVITKSNWGGAQKYVFDLAKYAQNKGFFSLVAIGGDGELKERLDEEKIKNYKIKNLNRDISLFKEISSFFNLLQIYRKESPDVIHLNSSKIGGLGSLAGRVYALSSRKKVKIIFTAHGWYFNEKINPLKKMVTWFLSYLTTIFCHKIITLSEKEFKQALQFPFVSKKKVYLIRNGIKEINFFDRQVAREKLGLKEDKFYLVSIAELHKNKGLDVLLKAVAGAKTDLIIIGDGEEKDNLEKLIEKLDIKKQVKMLGWLPEASRYLKAFDVFVLSSRKEGLPFVLLEAGLAGLPCILSSIGAIPEIIEGGKEALLVTPEKVDGLTNSINSLIKNSQTRESLGFNLEKKVSQKYSFQKMAEETIKLY